RAYGVSVPSSIASTGCFRRTRGRSPPVLMAAPQAAPRRSHFHDFRFFVLQEIVDRLRMVVGELLDALFRAPLVVVADVPFLAELLQVMHHVTTDVSHRD